MNGSIFVGQGDSPLYLLLPMANRHGLIAGATGTGKTVTLQILAEGFSSCGIPVFLADVKGDLAGISQPGEAHHKIMERAQEIGMRDLSFHGFPALYWDLFGEQGHQVRTTISEMGPLLLTRLFGLNEAQEGVLNIAFKLADSQGLLLLDFKDLKPEDLSIDPEKPIIEETIFELISHDKSSLLSEGITWLKQLLSAGELKEAAESKITGEKGEMSPPSEKGPAQRPQPDLITHLQYKLWFWLLLISIIIALLGLIYLSDK